MPPNPKLGGLSGGSAQSPDCSIFGMARAAGVGWRGALLAAGLAPVSLSSPASRKKWSHLHSLP